ncbi:hypothetical protein Pr1d_06260 [Bythopirellula goksoeyrii]|uniref:Uncharacterized protein n=1 Tax=Bythopirellula goksoeyrii TaxID=1400387 RepID=A0A5B9Q752_9BACT|nr:hypothetical protein Pr1d_06260 [Bythopirellula goksoeyrii]
MNCWGEWMGGTRNFAIFPPFLATHYTTSRSRFATIWVLLAKNLQKYIRKNELSGLVFSHFAVFGD